MGFENSRTQGTVERTNDPKAGWRRFPIGAELAPGGGAHFRVWAPRRHSIDVVIDSTDTKGADGFPLARDGEYFAGLVPSAAAGTRYKFRVDGADAYADPASRFQPDGPHGTSEIIDPSAFRWTDTSWKGTGRSGVVLYEMHVGTFTEEGTWRAAAAKLPELAELGITTIELMPIADFAGRFGWGYDGVNLFAPYRCYGRPDDFRDFINRAHSLGVGVILDVVYNHFGPDGNTAIQFSDAYCTDRYHTDWGPAIDFDGPCAGGTREFFLTNAEYWIREFHLDGLRLDATQNIYDNSPSHILGEISARVRGAAGERDVFIVAENESQDTRLLRPIASGGYDIDAAWNDDWHHSAIVALSGRDEAYYTDYAGTAREFVGAAKFGYLYQGQWYSWQQKLRGTPGLDLSPRQFVHFLENHDQVANSLRGDRLRVTASPRRVRALTALLLLGPQTPMLFQGQEFGSTRPFVFFADHGNDLIKLVHAGRSEFLSQFESIAALGAAAPTPHPGDPAAFERCKLDHEERVRHASILALHRDLIALRRNDDVLRGLDSPAIEAATLGDDAFVLRAFGREGDDRLLVVNLGGPLKLHIMPEPLLAPSRAGRWTISWSSEDPRYGGGGLPVFDQSMKDWSFPGDCAVLFVPGAEGDGR